MEERVPSSDLLWKDVLLPDSVTVSGLDEAVLLAVKKDWLKTARVIVEVSKSYQERSISLSYEIIGARLCELAALGQIDSQGDLQFWRQSEVRRRYITGNISA